MELWYFVWTQKKLWLVPILLLLLIMLVFAMISTKGGALAPFIYPLF